MKKTYVVFDVETTGLDHKVDQIIEIAAVKYNQDGQEIGIYHTMVKLEGGRKLDPFITKLTGITEKDLEGGMDEETAVFWLSEFIGDSVVIGQNVSFDLGFMSRHSDCLYDFIDTRALSYLQDPNESASLKNVCKRLGVDLVGHHRALNDVRATWQVFRKLMVLLGEESEVTNMLVMDNRGLTYIPPMTSFLFEKKSVLKPMSNEEIKKKVGDVL